MDGKRFLLKEKTIVVIGRNATRITSVRKKTECLDKSLNYRNFPEFLK